MSGPWPKQQRLLTERFFLRLPRSLNQGTRSNYAVSEGEQPSRLVRLLQPPGKINGNNVLQHIDRLNAIEELALPDGIALSVHQKSDKHSQATGCAYPTNVVKNSYVKFTVWHTKRNLNVNCVGPKDIVERPGVDVVHWRNAVAIYQA